MFKSYFKTAWHNLLKYKLFSVINIAGLSVGITAYWLNDFAYRTTIGGWIFVTAGLLAVIIAFGTISFQTIKAAVENPVKSLRSE